jgi:hypothetical protein
MTEFSCPSETFPSLPGVALRAPADWEPAASPGCAIAVRAIVSPDVFAANVLVTVQRHVAEFSLKTALAAVRAELESFPESKVEEPFEAAFGPDRYVLVNTALRHPEHGLLVQIHAYTSLLHGAMKDIVHVVGTCAGDRVTTDYPVLQQVMESTRLGS